MIRKTLPRHVVAHKKHRGKRAARHEQRCQHSGECTENGSGVPHRPLAKRTCHEGRSAEEAMSMGKRKHRQAQRSSPRRYTCQNIQRRTEESLRGHGCQGQLQGIWRGQLRVRFPGAKKSLESVNSNSWGSHLWGLFGGPESGPQNAAASLVC